MLEACRNFEFRKSICRSWKQMFVIICYYLLLSRAHVICLFRREPSNFLINLSSLLLLTDRADPGQGQRNPSIITVLVVISDFYVFLIFFFRFLKFFWCQEF